MKNGTKRLPPPPRAYRAMQAVMWPVLKVMGLSCERAYRLSTERMDRELTRGESVRLRVHLMLCGACRPVPGQFDRLCELVRSSRDETGGETGGESLPPEAKERIATRLRDDQS